jgi:hypothetical protein
MARRFGGKDKSKEAPVVDDGTFDPVKALDNAKFQEFLSKHENAGSLDGDPDTADDAELEKKI